MFWLDPPNRLSISQSCLSALGEEATISIINRQGRFATNQNRRLTCNSACLLSGFSSSAEDSRGRPGARLSICPQKSRLQTTSYEIRLHLTIRAKTYSRRRSAVRPEFISQHSREKQDSTSAFTRPCQTTPA